MLDKARVNMKKRLEDLDEDGLPAREGIYLVEGNQVAVTDKSEIEIYEYQPKGLCCFADDFGSSGTGVNDETDCHVSVQNTGLTFIKRLRNLR